MTNNDDDDVCGCTYGECDDDCDFRPCNVVPPPTYCHENDLAESSTESCDCICCGEICGENRLSGTRLDNFVCDKCICESACTPGCDTNRKTNPQNVTSESAAQKSAAFALIRSEVHIASNTELETALSNKDDDGGGGCDDCNCVDVECLAKETIDTATEYDIVDEDTIDKGTLTKQTVDEETLANDTLAAGEVEPNVKTEETTTTEAPKEQIAQTDPELVDTASMTIKEENKSVGVVPEEIKEEPLIEEATVEFKEPVEADRHSVEEPADASTAPIAESEAKQIICDGCHCIKGCNPACEENKKTYRGPVCELCGCTDHGAPCGAACLEAMEIRKKRICTHCLCSQGCNGKCEIKGKKSTIHTSRRSYLPPDD